MKLKLTLKPVICNLKDMKDFLNIEPYRVSLLGYGNMSGETMIFEVDGGSQRKLKNTLPIIIDLQCVQRAMAACI